VRTETEMEQNGDPKDRDRAGHTPFIVVIMPMYSYLCTRTAR